MRRSCQGAMFWRSFTCVDTPGQLRHRRTPTKQEHLTVRQCASYLRCTVEEVFDRERTLSGGLVLLEFHVRILKCRFDLCWDICAVAHALPKVDIIVHVTKMVKNLVSAFV